MTALTDTAFSFRRVSLPVLTSVVLHVAIIGGLFYASFHQIKHMPAVSQPVSVSLVAPEKQVEPNPQPEVAPPAAPQPQPRVEPLRPEPVPVAVPKPEPRHTPAKKVAEAKKQIKPHKVIPQASPFSQDKPAEVKSAPEPKTAGKSVVSHIDKPQSISLSRPDYPPRASALHIEGKVSVLFDVNSAGRVENIRITYAEPRNMFERTVRQAMKQWRYEAGRPGKNQTINIEFRMKGGSSMQ